MLGRLSDFHYRKFRREAIEQLVSRYPEKHGLVVNHTMGTGKTKTALLFLANFPKFPKLIIAPVSAHSEWVQGLAELKLTQYRLAVPEELDDVKITKKTVVVVDECHLLIPLLTSQRVWNLTQREQVLRSLQRSFKVLLLTGTPVKTHVSDLRLLINIAAGRDVIPSTRKAFQARYYRINKTRAATEGYLSPLLLKPTYKFFQNLITMTILYALFSRIVSHIIAYFRFKSYSEAQLRQKYPEYAEVKGDFNILRGQGIMSYLTNFSDFYGQGFLVDMFRFMGENTDLTPQQQVFRQFYRQQQQMSEPAFASTVIMVNTQMLLQQLCRVEGSGCQGQYDDLEPVLRQLPESERARIPKDLFTLEGKDAQKLRWTIPLWKFLLAVLKPMNFLVKQLSYLDVSLLSMLGMAIIGAAYQYYRKLGTIMELDTVKLGKDLQPYIVTYNPFLQKDRVMLRHFPQVKYVTQTYDLSQEQVTVLQKIMLQMLSEQELLALGFIPDELKIEVFEEETNNPYLAYGRMVSNLRPSRKFENILDMYQRRPQPTLIWSNFEKGLSNFAIEARARGLSTVRLNREDKPEQLKAALEGRVDFLLLPPPMVEGISLPGIEVMHILEPPQDVITDQQLKFRVIRYSDEPGKVTIFTWIGEMPSQRTRFMALLRLWKQVGLGEEPLTFSRRLKYDSSPDSMVFSTLSQATKDYEKLYKSFLTLQRKRRQASEVCVPVQPRKRATCPKYFEKKL
uniref:Helicase ATP-binding domain-containing protein n=1 Tax=viral metagenome TaxID=1070528 RepID=A0A6C0BNI6_9ZZZZ